MLSMTFKKEVLLEKLTENRKNHRKKFEEASDGYFKEAIARLEEQIAKAKAGKKFTTIIHLTQPTDQTEDYDRVISMLELSEETEIKLDESQYRKYVLDKWDWSDQFNTTHALYNNS